MKTKVNAIQCPKCGDIIYSRDRHDFHYCSCGEVSIDDGFDYIRVGFMTKKPKTVIKYINVSKQELFDDWNHRINKFGIIKNKK